MKSPIRLIFLSYFLLSPWLSTASPPVFNRLYPDGATATSYLQNNWNKYVENYHPNYALDDNPATGWVEGADGEGLQEALSFRVSALKQATRVQLKMRLGYHKSKSLFQKNAAPKELEITLLRDDRPVVTKVASFDRKMDWQLLEVELPGQQGFDTVELRIKSAWPGSAYKDNVISDVQVLVQSTVPYNRKVELAKQAAVQQWIQERLKEAKYFAKLPKSYPMIATQYEAKKRDSSVPIRFNSVTGELRHGDDEASEAPVEPQIKGAAPSPNFKAFVSGEALTALQELESLIKTEGKSFSDKTFRVVSSQVTPLPDGIECQALSDNQTYIDLSQVSFSESEGKPFQPKRDVYINKWDLYPARIKWADEAKKRPGSLFYWEKKEYEEREVYSVTNYYLVHFNDNQQPRAIVAKSLSEGVTAYTYVDIKNDGKKLTDLSCLQLQDFSHGKPYGEYHLTVYAPAPPLQKSASAK